MTTGTNQLKNTRTPELDLRHTLQNLQVKEPSAREINRQIREEAKAEKMRTRQLANGSGAGLRALDSAQRRHPQDPKKQLTVFMEDFVIRSGTGRPRPVSDRTRDAYSQTLMSVIDDLRADRMAIKNLGELGKTHVIRLVKLWVAREQSGVRIENKISVLRRFLTFIGKEKLIPKGQEFKDILNQQGLEIQNWRRVVTQVDKSWDAKDVDVNDVVSQVRQVCPYTAMQLEMQAAFGLRTTEALEIDPRGADYGDVLRVVHGTKGGRPRDVPFDDDQASREWQRDVLERAKLLAATNKKGILARPDFSLKSNRYHFYNTLRAFKITRKGLGVTSHGLRHGFASRRYNQISGMDTPVSGFGPRELTDEVMAADLHAQKEVSRSLGHHRPYATKAYIGSQKMMGKIRTDRVNQWIKLTEGNGEFKKTLEVSGVQQAWLAGRFASGLEVDQKEKLQLIVGMPGQRALGVEELKILQEGLNKIYQRGVLISQQLAAGEPDDALALHL